MNVKTTLAFAKSLMAAQKAIDDLDANEICAALDIAAEFAANNVEKYMSVTAKVTEYIYKSETIKSATIKCVDVFTKTVSRLQNDEKLVKAAEEFAEALEKATQQQTEKEEVKPEGEPQE